MTTLSPATLPSSNASTRPVIPPLETPVALLDTDALDANLRRMQQRVQALGVALRPHVKTAKCIPVALRQQALGAQGITVSTLREADEFQAAGFVDILYAVGITPNKLPHALSLCERGCTLRVIVDSQAAADAVVQAWQAWQGSPGAARAAASGGRLGVLIEIDVDGERAGLLPDAPALVGIGQRLHTAGLLDGVMTHGGGSYGMRGEAALQAFAEQERARCVAAAERLRAAGLPCGVISVGSTPTALSAATAAGVTEVRAGVYAFFDLVMAGLGVCRPDQIALSVLTTVIGHQPDKGWVLVDAGWMALSRDRGTQHQAVDQGYGLVCDEGGTPVDGWWVQAANQEHGIIAPRDGAPAGVNTDVAQQFPLGSRLRILPNHACATAAQFSAYHCISQGQLGETWPRFGGW
jgi:D-serine deaminase-like pyridoxal phosphate-dependent protein